MAERECKWQPCDEAAIQELCPYNTESAKVDWKAFMRWLPTDSGQAATQQLKDQLQWTRDHCINRSIPPTIDAQNS